MSWEKVCVGEHGEDVTLLAGGVWLLAEAVGGPVVTVSGHRHVGDMLAGWPDRHRHVADISAAPVREHVVRVTFLGGIAGIYARPCDKLGDMALGETLLRVQRALNLNQKELARLMGCSSRTVIRYYKRGGAVAPATYAELAVACHPHDVALAAHLAQQAGKTLISMGLESSPASVADLLLPSPRGPAPSPKHLVDSIVCAAAEAMQTPPHTMRPALTAAFERTIALGMTAEDVLRAMT